MTRPPTRAASLHILLAVRVDPPNVVLPRLLNDARITVRSLDILDCGRFSEPGFTRLRSALLKSAPQPAHWAKAGSELSANRSASDVSGMLRIGYPFRCVTLDIHLSRPDRGWFNQDV
jgi:hypothetical protein